MAKSFTTRAVHLIFAVLLLGGLAVGAQKKKSPSRSSRSKPAVKVSKKTAATRPKPTPTPAPLAPGELPLAARSAVVVDAKTGDVLYAKNPDGIEYPASATKILTALLVIESGGLDRCVTIEHEDTQVEPSALEFRPGEEYTRRKLLIALLLKSANDVALALARDNAGSVEAFAAKMNRRAEQLGALASHFTNPHGLHDPHHFTTAVDLARIACAAMRNSIFREIVSTPEAGITRGEDWVVLRNHNKLLELLPGCTGVKTGYTRAAQQVLVSSAIRAGREAISVVLHTDKPGIWEDSKLLLEQGFAMLGAPAIGPVSPVPAPGGTASAGSRQAPGN
jgi:D-alanyl-D-alanine carboxypeptidase (penicillin-binding protein 5/6)